MPEEATLRWSIAKTKLFTQRKLKLLEPILENILAFSYINSDCGCWAEWNWSERNKLNNASMEMLSYMNKS